MYKTFFYPVAICYLLLIISGCARTTYQPPCGPIADPRINPPSFPQQSLGKTIVIDPGHGGEDVGTRSLGSPKYQEKSLNLSTAFMLKNYLQQLGHHVTLTRNDDTFISLEDRASLANRLKPELFVSVHYNSAPSKEAEGVEVYYYRNDADTQRTVRSKELAKHILGNVIRNTSAKSRGIKHGNFAVIRETKIPAVLIEGGFLTNAKEMEKLKDAEYLKKIAWGIAQGVQAYLTN